MVKYLLLIIVLFGCRAKEKEPPFEWLTFYTTDDQQSHSFKIYSHIMKRYYHESIGEMLERNKRDYGVIMKGRWLVSGIVVDFSNTPEESFYKRNEEGWFTTDDTLYFSRGHTNGIFHDTIKSTFKKQTK